MSEPEPHEYDLIQELRDLGEQLKEIVRVAREHPHTKELERQISEAVHVMGDQFDQALNSAAHEDHVKRAGEQIKQVTQSIKESGAPDEISRGLAKGVRALNDEMRRAIRQADKTDSDDGSGHA
ncbi:MAG: hypothetical protein M1482_15990 [Chloroflexi bacterium]|nr:hypothetical protein [Chloroflexota bacterium]